MPRACMHTPQPGPSPGRPQLVSQPHTATSPSIPPRQTPMVPCRHPPTPRQCRAGPSFAVVNTPLAACNLYDCASWPQRLHQAKRCTRQVPQEKASLQVVPRLQPKAPGQMSTMTNTSASPAASLICTNSGRQWHRVQSERTEGRQVDPAPCACKLSAKARAGQRGVHACQPRPCPLVTCMAEKVIAFTSVPHTCRCRSNRSPCLQPVTGSGSANV